MRRSTQEDDGSPFLAMPARSNRNRAGPSSPIKPHAFCLVCFVCVCFFLSSKLSPLCLVVSVDVLPAPWLPFLYIAKLLPLHSLAAGGPSPGGKTWSACTLICLSVFSLTRTVNKVPTRRAVYMGFVHGMGE